MQVVWTVRFSRSLEFIYSCARDYYSRITLKKLNDGIKSAESLLADNPYLGSIEPLLENRDVQYRRFIVKPVFKLIYTVIDDHIYMMDIWDTRRDPKITANGLA